jgi:hypothetical protein
MSVATQELEQSLKGLIAAYKAQAIIRRIKGLIGAGSLSGGGKLNPAQGLPGGSGINPVKDPKVFKLYVPIQKVDAERREVTGVVLQPEVVDAQGDIMDSAVIEKAAGDFLAGFNKGNKLGFMHKQFNKKFELRQSFITPIDMVIANKAVKAGSWVMVVKVLDDKIWKLVKEGKVTGFSIGGKAKVQQLAA